MQVTNPAKMCGIYCRALRHKLHVHVLGYLNKKMLISICVSQPKMKCRSCLINSYNSGIILFDAFQVKCFLDSTCSLSDFVERYRGMFLRLKNAMEELFGQHTAFVLALRQGFSAALLQLSILTAMHVSQQGILARMS